MITLFIAKEISKWIIKGKIDKHSSLYRGLNLYKNTASDEKKSFITVLCELNRLSSYWHAFPDAYFRFGMFLKSYNNMEQMMSFVPQGAYSHFSIDKDVRYHVLIDDKIIFHDIMTQYGLPVPMRYFTFRGGEFRRGAGLLTDADVDSIISGISDERIFVKRFTGGAASGVSIFTKKDDGIYIDKDGDLVNAAMIRKKYRNQDFFFEKQIVQEPILRQFNPDTVNTIRVLTYKNKIISATVRFGGKGEFVDNVSKNGVAVSLDIESGVLGDYGMKMYSAITRFYEHPDSNVKFKDVKIAQWPDVKRIVEKTLELMPYYKSVGFDIATTEDGPVILEINTGAGINLSQTGKEYGLAKYFLNK